MLPSGYKLLEYIQSSGTQYIDTGFKANQDTKVVADVQFPTTPTTHSAIFGARAENTNQFWCYYRYSNNAYAIRYATNSDVRISYDATARATVTVDKNVMTVNDSSVTSTAGTFTSNYSMFLFAENNAGSKEYPSAVKMYACKIYDNGTLIRQYVPCINADGEVGLYDLVDAKFYGNAGTGVFTAGPELFSAQWIRSTGSQYIDTGFKPNNNTRLVADIEVTSGATSFLFGARNNSSANSTSHSFSMVQISGNSLRSDYGSVETTISVSPVQRLNIDKNKNGTTVNGTAVTATAQTFQGTYNLMLLTVNTAGTINATKTSAKIYFCQIYDNNTLIRDYIPMVDADGVGGLYDRVNCTFERDAANVGFEAMPELTELEYIESSGTQYIDTGFQPNQDSRVVCDIEVISLSGYAPLFGARIASKNSEFAAWAIDTKNFQDGYGASTDGAISGSPVQRNVIDKNKNVFVVNGSTLKTHSTSTFQPGHDLYLFNINTNGNTTGSFVTLAKLYSCQIYDNGTLVRDYIPVLASYGLAGLYDRANDELYLNSGTGTFIAGPVVVAGIPAPENLTASITDSSVTLTWDAVEDALFYTVLQDGIAVATTTETAYSMPLVPFANTVYGVTAVNDDFESTPAETLVQYIPEEYDLITDRTSADVQRVKYLRETGWAAMTEAERTEFLSPLKGAYNATDLNRVEYAAHELANKLSALPNELRNRAIELNVAWAQLFDVPYTPPVIQTRFDWTVRDIPTSNDMERYLSNVTLLRNILDYATSMLPTTMKSLTYEGANAIELALDGLLTAILELREHRLSLINNTASAWMFSGEIYGGDL